MGYSIKGTTISLTRGDTLMVKIDILDFNGESYVPSDGDKIRFALHDEYGSVRPLLIKEIPYDTLILRLEPEDTKELPFGRYVYDIELTTASGIVDTFIAKAKMKITEEVY